MVEQREDSGGTTPSGGSKERKVEDLIRELESIQGDTVDSGAFDYSNDRRVSDPIILPSIIEKVESIDAPLKVAIIVSHGALWSIPKELDIDLVIRLDMNARQIERDRERKGEILDAESPEELLPKPDPNLDEEDIIAVKKERNRLMTSGIERVSYGPFHYLSSKEQLERTKEFLKKGKIAFVAGNLTDEEFTERVGNILIEYGGKIVFADLTNVMGWVGGRDDPEKKEEYKRSLKRLPFDEACQILHSAHTGRVGRYPILSHLSEGLEDYIDFVPRETSLPEFLQQIE